MGEGGLLLGQELLPSGRHSLLTTHFVPKTEADSVLCHLGSSPATGLESPKKDGGPAPLPPTLKNASP